MFSDNRMGFQSEKSIRKLLTATATKKYPTEGKS